MKIWRLFYTFWQENKRRKKVFSLKCIQKSNVIKKRIWVLVFGFSRCNGLIIRKVISFFPLLCISGLMYLDWIFESFWCILPFHALRDHPCTYNVIRKREGGVRKWKFLITFSTENNHKGERRGGQKTQNLDYVIHWQSKLEKKTKIFSKI